jgi:hypothetical protein
MAIKDTEFFRGKSKPTWQPMAYTCYGIFQNFTRFDDMDWLRDDHAMCDSVKNVALVNIQKLPSKA